MSNVMYQIETNVAAKRKMLAVLIDPDKCSDLNTGRYLENLKLHTPDFIFMGGSQLKSSFSNLIGLFRSELGIPVVLFPGDVSQFSPDADALLFLSLLSGRNAEYLVGQHIKVALKLRDSALEVIPTGYLLVDGGCKSAVEYVSNTQPIPDNATEIAIATALAGVFLGMKLIYLEAGSGAHLPVPLPMIREVNNNIQVPLIVGGGINTAEKLYDAFSSGADLVVIGNVLESSPEKIVLFKEIQNQFNAV